MENIEGQIQLLEQETSALTFEVKPIATAEDRVRYNEALDAIEAQVKRIEVIEGEICDPLYKHWRHVKAMFTKAKAPAMQMLAAINGELKADRERQRLAVAKEQERQNKLALKRYQRAQESGKGLPLPGPIAPIVQGEGKHIVVGGRTKTWVENWKAKVVDESLLPREYLMPDMVKLNAAAKANINVPGMVRYNAEYQR